MLVPTLAVRQPLTSRAREGKGPAVGASVWTSSLPAFRPAFYQRCFAQSFGASVWTSVFPAFTGVWSAFSSVASPAFPRLAFRRRFHQRWLAVCRRSASVQIADIAVSACCFRRRSLGSAPRIGALSLSPRSHEKANAEKFRRQRINRRRGLPPVSPGHRSDLIGFDSSVRIPTGASHRRGLVVPTPSPSGRPA